MEFCIYKGNNIWQKGVVNINKSRNVPDIKCIDWRKFS